MNFLTTTKLSTYQNGNTSITIYEDGTRIVELPEDEPVKFTFPLNIDIRLSNSCPFGAKRDKQTNELIPSKTCGFCHESATVDGDGANMENIKKVLHDSFHNIEHKVELAIGVNDFIPEIIDFLRWTSKNGFINNITVNQLNLNPRNTAIIHQLIDEKIVYGIGISYRRSARAIPQSIFQYENTIVHVICGLDTIQEIGELYKTGVRKIFVLGEKDFGFNKWQVRLLSNEHLKWKKYIKSVVRLFDLVSFDNLALQQLNVNNDFLKSFSELNLDWNNFYQGEHSMYINAVDEYFSPSSRSDMKIGFDKMSLVQFFQFCETEQAKNKDFRN